MPGPMDKMRDTLSRIAATVGVPLADLFDEAASAGPQPSSDEILRLFRAFTALTDPQTRHRILDTVEREAWGVGTMYR